MSIARPPTGAAKMTDRADGLPATTKAVPETISLKSSWTYQHRMGVTAITLAVPWTFAAISQPAIVEGTPIAWTLNAAGWLSFLAGSFLRIWATTWITGR